MPWSRVEAWEVFIQIKAKLLMKNTLKLLRKSWTFSFLFFLHSSRPNIVDELARKRLLRRLRFCLPLLFISGENVVWMLEEVVNVLQVTTAKKTSLKKCTSASNLISLIPSRSIRQMLATVSSWSWILKDCIKVQETRKRKSLSCVHVLHKSWN